MIDYYLKKITHYLMKWHFDSLIQISALEKIFTAYSKRVSVKVSE